MTISTGYIEITEASGWWNAARWVHSKIGTEYYDDLVCKWNNLAAKECFI